MSISVNDAGTWKDATPYCKDGSVWKQPLEVWVNDADTWKKAWPVGVTFNPEPGSYYDDGVSSASFTVTSSIPVTWTWGVSGGTGVVSSRTQGQSATSITFSLSGTSIRTRTVNLTATSNGVTYSWTIVLQVSGYA